MTVTLNEKDKIIYQPQTVALIVSNTPAKIRKIECKIIKIKDSERTITFEHVVSNIIRFPDDKSQWTFHIAKFPEILKNLTDGEKLERFVHVKYSNLSDGETYFYKINSKYLPLDKNWQTICESGN